MPPSARPATSPRRKPPRKNPWPVIILIACLILVAVGVAVFIVQLTAPAPESSTTPASSASRRVHSSAQATDLEPTAEPDTDEDAAAEPATPEDSPSRSLSDATPPPPEPAPDPATTTSHPESSNGGMSGTTSTITRSPLAQPGETLRRPLPMPRLDGGGEALGSETPKGVVPWNRAHQYVGKTITIEGRVVVTRNTGHVCFLNFDKNWQGKFYVILFKDVLDDWPQPPEQYFKDKTIRVTGEVTLRASTPQMQVEAHHQITLAP